MHMLWGILWTLAATAWLVWLVVRLIRLNPRDHIPILGDPPRGRHGSEKLKIVPVLAMMGLAMNYLGQTLLDVLAYPLVVLITFLPGLIMKVMHNRLVADMERQEINDVIAGDLRSSRSERHQGRRRR